MDNPLTVPAASVSEPVAVRNFHNNEIAEFQVLRSKPYVQDGRPETEEPPQADVPGVGRMPIANLRGRDQVAGEMPSALRAHLRDQILIRLMFAARDLAEKNLGRALLLSGKAGLFCRECGCAAKGVGHLGHSALCGTGRVLGFIEELQAVCGVSSNSIQKEVAPAEEEGRAGDGIRSRGPLGEPWKFASDFRGYSICDSEGDVVIDLEGSGSGADGKRLALMERIVDCVNTLAPFAAKGGAQMTQKLSPSLTAAAIYNRLRLANEQAAREIRELLPIGTILQIQLCGHMITIEVTGYGREFSDPLEIWGINRSSKKRRKFSVGFGDFWIVERSITKVGQQ